MVERDGLEGQVGLVTDQLLPRHSLAEPTEVRVTAEVGQDDRALQAWHLTLQARDHVHPVEVTPVVAVTVDGEQHLGLDLRDAVHHGAGTEVGRAAQPHRAQARRGQEGGDRLSGIGHVGDDAIAALHSLRP
jgi:hypothetical protein